MVKAQLQHLESLFLDSEALAKLRSEYAGFLFPNLPSTNDDSESGSARDLLPLYIFQTRPGVESIPLWSLRTSFLNPEAHQISTFVWAWSVLVECSRLRAANLHHRLSRILHWMTTTACGLCAEKSGLRLTRSLSAQRATAGFRRKVKAIARPSLKQGYERIEWKCVSLQLCI